MQEKKIKFTDVLFVGLAFFASYFGAGTLSLEASLISSLS